MNSKTYALITDVHSNSAALKKGMEIINSRDDIDKIVFLGDNLSFGPEPREVFDILKSNIKSVSYTHLRAHETDS